MDTTQAQALLDQSGLNVRTRDEIMNTDFPVYAYSGATSRSEAWIAEQHAEIRSALRERVSRYAGAYVIYEPSGDADDWMLVGDDLTAIVKESLDHHEEIRL